MQRLLAETATLRQHRAHMENRDGFAAKLRLVLGALSMSRGRLAAGVGVDKSLVSRWCSGAIVPSSHNLSRLSEVIAGRHPGFTMLDWDADLETLAARFGVDAPGAAATEAPAAHVFDDLLPPSLLGEALTTTRLRGAAFEGIWRTTRISVEHGGRFVHDYMLQRVAPNGLLTYTLGVLTLRFRGWAFPIQNQLFSLASDPMSGVFIFSIVKGVARHKAAVLDGLTLTCLRNTDGDIVATPCLFERVADLTGDPEADRQKFEDLMRQPALAPEGSIPPEIRAHLLPNAGPDAARAGGDLVLMMKFARSLSRAALVAEWDPA